MCRRIYKIKDLDIVKTIIHSLKQDNLTTAELSQYFQSNAALLKNNIESSYYRYGKRPIPDIVEEIFPRYITQKDRILANEKEYTVVKGEIVDKVQQILGEDTPELILVPCLGLFSSNGWAQEVNGQFHICIALEFNHKDMDITLAHEIAHGTNKPRWDSILDMLYNEGYATYVSSVMCPGHHDADYLFNESEWYTRCLDWIKENKNKILADAARDLVIMDKYHLFYFGGANKQYPRIGYVIGFLFLRFLHERYSIKALSKLGNQTQKLQNEFELFTNS